MLLDHCVSEANATSCWHQCPNCKTVRMTSEPIRKTPIDDKAYAVEADYPGSYNETFVVA